MTIYWNLIRIFFQKNFEVWKNLLNTEKYLDWPKNKIFYYEKFWWFEKNRKHILSFRRRVTLVKKELEVLDQTQLLLCYCNCLDEELSNPLSRLFCIMLLLSSASLSTLPLWLSRPKILIRISWWLKSWLKAFQMLQD